MVGYWKIKMSNKKVQKKKLSWQFPIVWEVDFQLVHSVHNILMYIFWIVIQFSFCFSGMTSPSWLERLTWNILTSQDRHWTKPFVRFWNVWLWQERLKKENESCLISLTVIWRTIQRFSILKVSASRTTVWPTIYII